MSLVVHAYVIQTFGHTYLPAGACLLRVAFRDGQLWLWALVDLNAHQVGRKINSFTDDQIMGADPGVYVGSAQPEYGGPAVNVFDLGEQ